MRADRSPSTQPSPMTMGCDRQEHTSREQGGWEQVAAYRLTIVGEEVDTRGYKRAVSNRQQVGLRATLAKPAHFPADSHSKESQHSTIERRAFDRSAH
eukprot:scaffold24364_cov70-Phaeocystis_antarctica.AAC.2